MKATIVEDESALLTTLEEILKLENIEVEKHNNYDFMPDGKSDVYILDYNIVGGINGSEWIDKYKVSVEKRILVSGADGWKDYDGLKLDKPYGIDDIINAVKKVRDTNETSRF